MKSVIWVASLAVVLLIGIACAPASWAGERIRFAGKEYVRVDDWARANRFELRSSKRDEFLRLSRPGATLTLPTRSIDARINGVQVRLLFPLVTRGDAFFISELDLQTTIAPVLTPERSRAGAAIRTICLDPGHGGKDPGFGTGSNHEKRFTLMLAQELRDQLKRAGYKVFLTRNTDSFVELLNRPETANRGNADLLLSLHFNSAEGVSSAVQGTEVYCLTPAGAPSSNARGEGGGAGWFPGNRHNSRNLFLAYHLQKTLSRDLATVDRGVHRARFAVLREARMPAVLIEAGFMSHPAEGRKIFTAAYRRQIAAAILSGVRAYQAALDPTPASPSKLTSK